MQPVLNIEKIKSIMEEQGLSITALAARTGLSRQRIYKLMDPGYQPFSKGFRELSTALHVAPQSLLRPPDPVGDQCRELLALAISGEARGFEMLPSHVVHLEVNDALIDTCSMVEKQLLTAALELAFSISKTRVVQRNLRRMGQKSSGGHAFFFGSDLMPPERIVMATPPEMARHLVFGAFNRRDFERHFRDVV